MAKVPHDPRHEARGFPLAEWEALTPGEIEDEVVARDFEAQLVAIRIGRALDMEPKELKSDAETVPSVHSPSVNPEAMKEVVSARRSRLAKERIMTEERRLELARYAGGNAKHLGIAS
jgi:hypothetical protein